MKITRGIIPAQLWAFLFVFTAFLLSVINANAQKGIISGTVTDKANQEKLFGVTVRVANTSLGAQTGPAGDYKIEVPAGSYTIVFSSLSYKSDSITGVKVAAGQTVRVDLPLENEGKTLQGVTVAGKKDQTSEISLLKDRQEATVVVQKMGLREMERKGVSNVAEGLTKVTGVSVVGSQQLFIRGLGDRYNNAVLNGLPVPSVNPDFKVIPLDIFPTGIVQNLSIIKSYASNYYGDFSGGMVDIATREYPTRPFFKISVSGGFNSQATGKDFYEAKPGTSSFFGFTRGDRGLPDEVKLENFYETKPGVANKNPFTVPFSPALKQARPKIGFGISGGDHKRWGDKKEFGYMFSASFKNDYRIYSGIDKLLNANKVDLFSNNLDIYNYSANTTGLLNLYYKANENNRFSFTSLFVNNASDEVMDIDGINPDLGPVFSRLSTNIQNTVWVNQLHGKHKLGKQLNFNWSGSYATTTGSLPERTQTSFLYNTNGNGERRYFFNRDILGNNHKFFGELKEQEGAVKLELERRGAEERKERLKSLKAGVDLRYKDRTFDARQVDIRTTSITYAVNPFNVDTTLTEAHLSDGFTPGTWGFAETYYPSNNYKAHLAIIAPYISAAWAFTDKAELLLGVRAEYSDQVIKYKRSNDTYARPLREFQRDKIDPLPFATFKYNVTKKNVFLVSASRTLTRPLFLELAPFRYNQGFNRLQREGNPELENSVNYNADIKFEIYPDRGELMAITVFGKYIQKPIEQMMIISSDRLTTMVNSDNAVLWGAELEVVRNVGNIFGSSSDILKSLGVGLNVAYIHSRIKIDPEKSNASYPIAPTNKERPMFGASPYLVNFDLNYKKTWSQYANTQATLTYNIYGKRVIFAGNAGAGDVYEMPAGTLDLNINNQISKRFNVDLSVGNILNPVFRQEQFFNDEGITINEYTKGITAGLSLGYTF